MHRIYLLGLLSGVTALVSAKDIGANSQIEAVTDFLFELPNRREQPTLVEGLDLYPVSRN